MAIFGSNQLLLTTMALQGRGGGGLCPKGEIFQVSGVCKVYEKAQKG